MVNKHSNLHGMDCRQGMAPHIKTTQWPPADKPNERQKTTNLPNDIHVDAKQPKTKNDTSGKKTAKEQRLQFSVQGETSSSFLRLEAIPYAEVQATGGWYQVLIARKCARHLPSLDINQNPLKRHLDRWGRKALDAAYLSREKGKVLRMRCGLFTIYVQTYVVLLAMGTIYRGADVLSKIVEDKPEFSLVQVSAVVTVVFVEKGPEQLLQAHHNLIWQDKAILFTRKKHSTYVGSHSKPMLDQQCLSTWRKQRFGFRTT